MKKKCFICKNSKVGFLLRKNGYDLWHCEKCKLNFIYPQPTDKELQKVYSLDGGYSHSSKGFDGDAVSAEYEKRIDFFVENGVKRVLDVGCASGAFVYSVKRRGLDVVGIDLDKDSIKFGKKKGLDLRYGGLEDMGFKAGSFDAVNLGDIIEHVKAPERFLGECLRVLKGNGVLVVSTPNTNSLFPKMTKWVYDKFGLMWSHPAPPYHLFDFSDENLVRFLKKNGVEVLGVSYSRIPLMYSIYHTGYFDEMRGKMRRVSFGGIFGALTKSFGRDIFQQVMVSFIYVVLFYIDKLFEKKGDQMIIYAVKK
ncbi:class I SAM-dependent methyltransferase [archaeon]|nr:class I SAM-dependent methyltransferase [archaeon]